MKEESLAHVAVIGAAGKMGSGIALLLLQEMARSELDKRGEVGSGEVTLTLIDTQEQALVGLRHYLRAQITKFAEKQITSLRRGYANNPRLVSNEEMVRAFVEGALDIVRFDADVASARTSKIIFEAIVEDVKAKEQLYATLKSQRGQPQFYLTNTSSIPIQILNDKCHLENRIVGFHFYNPPPVQKVIEVVYPPTTVPELQRLTQEFTQRLHKTAILSRDVAGFIGNGYLMRMIRFACDQVRQLSTTHGLPQALVMVNQVTQDYLLWPMGIFQLIDYVGIDICHHIASIMATYLPDPKLSDPLIESVYKAGVKGGQHQDGSQKDGFFQYTQQQPKAVYDLRARHYVPFPDSSALGSPFPITRKQLQQDRNVQHYFETLAVDEQLGATLAKAFLQEEKQVAQLLLSTGVVASLRDLDLILQQGFFHAVGVSEQMQPSRVR